MSAERPLVSKILRKMPPAALFLCAAGALATPAAAEPPRFNNIEISGGFNVETILVEQENGMWTRISDHPRTIPIHVTIEMSRGYIEFYRVGRNLTNGAVRDIFSTYIKTAYGNQPNPIEAIIDSRTSVSGPANILIDEFTRLNQTDEQAIVNRCNANWTETEQGHSFSYPLPLAIHADAREKRRKRFPYYLNEYEGYGDFGRATAFGFVGLKIECLGQNSKPPVPDSKPPSDDGGIPRTSGTDTPRTPDDQDLAFDQGPMTVNDIRLTLTTYSNAYTEPTAGTRCKKAKLRVTLETNQEGPVSFRLWEQRGDGAITSEDVDAQAQHEGGYFRAVHERWVEVDGTTSVQFNARDLVNETFNQETGWKDITLQCTGAGGGGLASPSGTDDDDNTPKIAAFQGNFQFIDNGPLAQSNTCPRNAKALVWFDAPKADNIHYSLDCGALGNFSGVLQPEQVASSHYRAATLINFDITDTIEAGCTLRTVSPGDPIDHAFTARTFQCVKASGHSSGIGDLTGSKRDPGHDLPKPAPRVNPAVGGGVGVLTADPNPTHAPPRAPDRSGNGAADRAPTPARTNPTPPQPRLVCTGGRIARGTCQCGQNKIRRQTGSASYQCIAVAKPPEPKRPARTNPTPRRVEIVCRGGRVANGKCRCGPNRNLVKIGKTAFACQKKRAVRSDQRTNPSTRPLSRVNPAPRRQSVVCRGGTVRAGRCICGRQAVARKLGARRFACVPRRG